MTLKFTKTQSTVEPQKIWVNGNWAYIRRNITKTVDNSGEISITFYNYEEAKLGIEQFNAYANQILMNGQENNENNQLALMEAMADMYETMALGV